MENIFSKSEKLILDEISEEFSVQIEAAKELFSIFRIVLKLNDVQELEHDKEHFFGINLLLTKNLSLLLNSFELFIKGYSFTAIPILRMIGEALLFSLLFYYIPEEFNEYHERNHFEFKYYLKKKYNVGDTNSLMLIIIKILEGLSEDIESKSEKHFPNFKALSYLNELHEFIHTDIDLFFNLSVDNSQTNDYFIKNYLGPFKPETKVLENYFRIFNNLFLFSFLLLEEISKKTKQKKVEFLTAKSIFEYLLNGGLGKDQYPIHAE